MHKTQAEALEFLQTFLPLLQNTPEDRDVILCAPFTTLTALSKNLHAMLLETGVRYVVIGHSERRQFFGETDATVNQRLKAAQSHRLTPILCVGESKAQRDANETEAVIFEQLEKGLVGVDQTKLIIAYEPIWAIGTGDTCESSEV